MTATSPLDLHHSVGLYQITRKDKENRLSSIPLEKYASFTKAIWKELDAPIGGGFRIEVRRNRHTIPLDSRLIDFISKQINALPDTEFEELIKLITEKPKMMIPNPELENSQKIIDATINLVEVESKRRIVVPLLQGLEEHIEEQSVKGLEDFFDTEEELIDLILAPAQEALGAALNTALVDKDFSEYETLVRDTLSVEVVKPKLLEYFQSFHSADVYNELLDISNTIKQKENHQIYLYITDITYENTRYPLISIPLEFSCEERRIRLEAVPHLYINKHAIDYISQQLALEHGRKV